MCWSRYPQISPGFTKNTNGGSVPMGQSMLEDRCCRLCRAAATNIPYCDQRRTNSYVWLLCHGDPPIGAIGFLCCCSCCCFWLESLDDNDETCFFRTSKHGPFLSLPLLCRVFVPEDVPDVLVVEHSLVVCVSVSCVSLSGSIDRTVPRVCCCAVILFRPIMISRPARMELGRGWLCALLVAGIDPANTSCSVGAVCVARSSLELERLELGSSHTFAEGPEGTRIGSHGRERG